MPGLSIFGHVDDAQYIPILPSSHIREKRLAGFWRVLGNHVESARMPVCERNRLPYRNAANRTSFGHERQSRDQSTIAGTRNQNLNIRIRRKALQPYTQKLVTQEQMIVLRRDQRVPLLLQGHEALQVTHTHDFR